MAKFSLEVGFDGALHGPAYRAIIGKALDEARQAVRSTAKLQDDLKTPMVGVPDPVTVGHWKIEL